MPEAHQTIGVLFVCLGNICRSPLAEGLFLHHIEKAGLSHRFRVESAGTGAWHVGHRPDRRSLAIAERRGIALPSLARQVATQDFHEFTYILCMDADNLHDLRRAAPRASHAEIALVRAFDPEAEPGAEVPDPYHGGESDFENVYLMLDRACAGFLARQKELGLLD
jgi:protein-tyrosine phosphatase